MFGPRFKISKCSSDLHILSPGCPGTRQEFKFLPYLGCDSIFLQYHILKHLCNILVCAWLKIGLKNNQCPVLFILETLRFNQ